MADLDAGRVIGLLLSDDRLRVFVRDDRIVTIPARLARRRLLLDAVAQGFEPGVRYPERVVSAFLTEFYDDHAALRRYLVDEGTTASTGAPRARSTPAFPRTQGPGKPPARPGQPARASRPAWRNWPSVQPRPAGSSGRVAAVKISAARR